MIYNDLRDAQLAIRTIVEASEGTYDLDAIYAEAIDYQGEQPHGTHTYDVADGDALWDIILNHAA